MNESLLEPGVEFVEESSEKDLRDWLFLAFRDGLFDPVPVFPEPSCQQQICWLFARCSAQAQNKLKSAVVRAVAETQVHAHGFGVLQDLCYLACDLGASDVVRVLAPRLKFELIHFAHQEECDGAIGAIVAAIGKFASLDEAREALEHLLLDERFAARFGAALVATLCRTWPRDYARYVPRLVDLLGRYPQHYFAGDVIRELERIIGHAVIAEYLHEIQEPVHSRFEELLAQHTHLPIGSTILEVEVVGGQALVQVKAQRSQLRIVRSLCELTERQFRNRGTLWFTQELVATIRETPQARNTHSDASEGEES